MSSPCGMNEVYTSVAADPFSVRTRTLLSWLPISIFPYSTTAFPQSTFHFSGIYEYYFITEEFSCLQFNCHSMRAYLSSADRPDGVRVGYREAVTSLKLLIPQFDTAVRTTHNNTHVCILSYITWFGGRKNSTKHIQNLPKNIKGWFVSYLMQKITLGFVCK